MRPKQRSNYLIIVLVMVNNGGNAVQRLVGFYSAVAHVAFVKNVGLNGVGRRTCCQNVHNGTLVIATHGEIYLPFVFGRPMPIQHVFSLRVPLPIDVFPQLVHFLHQLLLFLIPFLKKLSSGNQSLHQKSRFYQITAVVVSTYI